MAELEISFRRQNRSVLLAPRGWMDISNVGPLLEAVRKLLEENETQRIGIDLEQTEYIDSAAVSTLIQAKSLADDTQKPFALVSLAPQVRRVLEETRLIGIFPVYPHSDAFFVDNDRT